MTNRFNEDIYGQYASDRILLGADDTHLVAAGADDRGDGKIGFHTPDTLFDEASRLPDEATGRIPEEMNDLEAVEGFTVVSDEVALGGIHETAKKSKKDLADEWMKEQGFTW